MEIENCMLEKIDSKNVYKKQIIWRNVFGMIAVHVYGLYAVYFGTVSELKPRMFLLAFPLLFTHLLGVNIGAHRLWCHRSFKATKLLRFLLMLCQTMSVQKDIYDWCRDHRVHHKFSETDADPHNSNRGWFFAHMGWLMCRKHPEVIAKGSTLDLSDLLDDPIVYYQRKFYYPLVVLFGGLIPTAYLYYFVGEQKETWFVAFGVNVFRWLLTNHLTWLINSSTHIYGVTPYDTGIRPKENPTMRYLGLGEGYHNYHHSFPWDYCASELNWNEAWNPAAACIAFFAWSGLAYDLKKVSPEVIERKIGRTGDTKQLVRPVNGFFDYLFGALFGLAFVYFFVFIRFFTKLYH